MKAALIKVATLLGKTGLTIAALVLVAVSAGVTWFGIETLRIAVAFFHSPYYDSGHWLEDAFLSHGAPGQFVLIALYAIGAGLGIGVFGYFVWRRFCWRGPRRGLS